VLARNGITCRDVTSIIRRNRSSDESDQDVQHAARFEDESATDCHAEQSTAGQLHGAGQGLDPTADALTEDPMRTVHHGDVVSHDPNGMITLLMAWTLPEHRAAPAGVLEAHASPRLLNSRWQAVAPDGVAPLVLDSQALVGTDSCRVRISGGGLGVHKLRNIIEINSSPTTVDVGVVTVVCESR